MNTSNLPRVRYILGVAIAMTLFAELFYFSIWGIALFPAGNLAAKALWTFSCGIAMGALIGAATLLWIEGRHSGSAAFWRAAVTMMTVGTYCTWLCSRIDIRFEYFGGSENSLLFITAGIVPAIAGGLLYGWIVYGRGVETGQSSNV